MILTNTLLENKLEPPTLTTALAAAERGWYIFPVEPYGKRPWDGISSWPEAAANDPTIIRESGWPQGANVGIAAKPSGLLIVDLDQHGRDDGVKAFSDLCRTHEQDGDWPNTLFIETPTGGYHGYFLDPSGRFGNGRGQLPPGIDVRGGGQGSGGYVLAAGSIIDRRAYEGNPELQGRVGCGRPYKIYNDAPVLTLPIWLGGLLLDGTPPDEPQRRTSRRARWAVKIENTHTLSKRLDGAISRLPRTTWRSTPSGRRRATGSGRAGFTTTPPISWSCASPAPTSPAPYPAPTSKPYSPGRTSACASAHYGGCCTRLPPAAPRYLPWTWKTSTCPIGAPRCSAKAAPGTSSSGRPAPHDCCPAC